jgi:hypothetical protein
MMMLVLTHRLFEAASRCSCRIARFGLAAQATRHCAGRRGSRRSGSPARADPDANELSGRVHHHHRKSTGCRQGKADGAAHSPPRLLPIRCATRKRLVSRPSKSISTPTATSTSCSNRRSVDARGEAAARVSDSSATRADKRALWGLASPPPAQCRPERLRWPTDSTHPG